MTGGGATSAGVRDLPACRPVRHAAVQRAAIASMVHHAVRLRFRRAEFE
jgi:hypothetical protein